MEFLEKIRSIASIEIENTHAPNPLSIQPRGFATEATVCVGNHVALVKLVQIANEFCKPLYIISRGRNWGLGSSFAPTPDCVLVSLKNMRSIEAYDENSGTVRIEPGVSFDQLASFLEDQSSPWQAPAIGGPADASVIANALERGDGVGQLGDRANHIYDMRIVLGNGEQLLTHTPEETDPQGLPWHDSPIGPSIHGLFVQSNLGIVSSASIRLAPRALETVFAMVKLTSDSDPISFVQGMQSLIHEKILEPRAISLWNGVKQLSRNKSRSECSIEELDPDGLNGWAATCFFQGFHEDSVSFKWAHAKKILGEFANRFTLFNDRTESGDQIRDQATGHSENRNVRSLYWEKETAPDTELDPDRDNCGSLWVCCAIPFSVSAIETFDRLCREAFSDSSLMPNLGIQVVSHRAAHGFLAINYDRDLNGADGEALAIHDKAIALFQTAGFLINRLGIQSMHLAPQLMQGRMNFLESIKDITDPKRIISPGRYIKPNY